MKKTGVLNKDLSEVIASIGHLESLTVCDAGFPVNDGVRRIDLAIEANLPSFLSVVKAISKELEVEKLVFASELAKINPALIEKIEEIFPDAKTQLITHEELKASSKKSRAIVRTGEFSSYANVILIAGVIF